MPALIVSLCIAVVIFLYFQNNPLGHGAWFLTRRFINWFPLALTYSFMYMARYNLNVAKGALGGRMSNEDFGIIFGVGSFVYAFSFLINGPLVDKIGGKKGILIGAIGAGLANIALGVLTYNVVMGHSRFKLLLPFSALYGLNMYFQSYGAVSIIKVKAYWFHVRERGIFGAILGTFISVGIYFAFDWGQAIADMAKAHPENPIGWFQRLIQYAFASRAGSVDALWSVFYVPAAVLFFWAVIDWWLIKDTPEEAGFPPFDAADASTGQMHIELSTKDLLLKVFANPLMLTVAAIGFTAGVMRSGIMNWYKIFAQQAHEPGTAFFTEHWGLLVCIFGIAGGFLGGVLSDKFFQSRRGPPAAICSAVMLVLAAVIALFLYKSPHIVGWSAVLITLFVIGVHSLMAGTAAPDFGGRKATATCSGIADGFVYLGGSVQSFALGYLTEKSWHWWPLFLMPFAALGIILSASIWNQLPAATRKYIEQHENKPTPGGSQP
ncbi:MAG TPA: MFS transporter [Verrucomicrobiae bacterium]|jgi:OPA family glycerol-3-phosphate transporter-like MFS transporter